MLPKHSNCPLYNILGVVHFPVMMLSDDPHSPSEWCEFEGLCHGCQMAIAIFLDRMCLALRASELWLRCAAKFDPFLFLDCARVDGHLATLVDVV